MDRMQPPRMPAQHPSLAAALEVASPGDIVQMLPSPLSYGDATLSIPITLQGGGHVADPLSGAYAKIGTVSVATSDVRIEGLYLRSVMTPSAGEVIEHVEVISNRYYGSEDFVSTEMRTPIMEPSLVRTRQRHDTSEAPNGTPIFTVSASDTSWSIDHNYIDQYWPFQRVGGTDERR